MSSLSHHIPEATEHCYHCGDWVNANTHFRCSLEGKEQVFCCPACMAVANTIVDAGLSAFYRYQSTDNIPVEKALLEEDFYAFDDPDFQSRFVTLQQEHQSHTRLLIDGIHCAACIWLLEHQLRGLPGVISAHVSFSEQKATISWDNRQLKLSDICQRIARIGYHPEPYQQEKQIEKQRQEARQALSRLGVAGIGMMQVGMFAIALYAGDMQSIADQYRDLMRATSWIVATVVLLYSSQTFFIGAWRGLKQKRPGMDLPVALAIGLAYIASCKATLLGVGEVYFDSVTMFTFLLLGGRYLDMRARHYSGRQSTDLQSLLPSMATKITEGQTQSIPLNKLQVNDEMMVKPGDIIPADGVITKGHSSLNEAQLTGEFTPLAKGPGDTVIAGSVNMSNTLIATVKQTGGDLKIQKISELLDRAQAHKPKIAMLADRLSSYFIAVVLLVTTGTYFYWSGIAPDNAFWITLSVLVVSCPCALSLATPTALTAATNRLRRAGLLVVDAQMWEKTPTVDHIVFDKTGTLTKGKLTITQTVALSTVDTNASLLLAARLEGASEHPIAKAFPTATESLAEEITITIGGGITGFIEGQCYRIGHPEFSASLYTKQPPTPPNTEGQWVLLSSSNGPIAWFQLEDVLREDAASLVAHLQQQGFHVHLLSGDRSDSANQLCHELAIQHRRLAATPDDKLDYINQLQAQGAKVLMLGDGINDIPVLAAADISIAMTNASDLAKTHADGILLNGRLQSISTLLSLAQQTKRTIWQNLGWALLYNLSVIPLAAQGLIPPYVAALGMSLSSLFVLLNALRLQRWQDNA